ncbi:jg14242 [Pararge aegeria aegeria]|uniref:Jg14242 protein n=1 Tax=Pararge aegeria aegeria TaxID=348720 RepID=A0A8S4RV24_9NEOP|nr:jg14242 [Pararge aegeria aegeria]
MHTCDHLHGIVPALDRPITGRPLPQEILQSPLPARQKNDDVDDARSFGFDNIDTRAGDDFADSDAGTLHGRDKPTGPKPMMAGPSP